MMNRDEGAKPNLRITRESSVVAAGTRTFLRRNPRLKTVGYCLPSLRDQVGGKMPPFLDREGIRG
jgi:hypothetical protein